MPHNLNQVDISKMAYLFIDVNYVHPKIAIEEYFEKKLVPSFAKVVDGFGFVKSEHIRLASMTARNSKGLTFLAPSHKPKCHHKSMNLLFSLSSGAVFWNTILKFVLIVS